jgi:hypothetical protein
MTTKCLSCDTPRLGLTPARPERLLATPLRLSVQHRHANAGGIWRRYPSEAAANPAAKRDFTLQTSVVIAMI